MTMRTQALIIILAGVLAGCDSGQSAVETRERTPAPQALLAAEAPAEPAAPTTPAPAATPVTANRSETADAKIQRLFQRNGAAFGARTAEDYLAQVRAFTRNPPRDAETVKRPNGDTLIYQASTNTFAVTDRNGVPRTMFKPDDGAAYWAEQKARAPTFGQRRREAE